MKRDAVPAIYVYHVDYKHPSGKWLTRKGLVALVGLVDFSEGIVKPHEMTFMDVTSDRLQLLETCQAHFSQIFSLFSDSNNEIMDSLEKACSDDPVLSVVDQDESRHRIWPVTDPETLNRVQLLFQERALYIADGHHRYTTALQMREIMKERLGGLPEDSPYNFVPMYLCGMEDPGLSVLPTHRLVKLRSADRLEGTAGPLSTDKLSLALESSFHVEEIKAGPGVNLLEATLSRLEKDDDVPVSGGNGVTVLGLYHTVEERSLLLTSKPGIMRETFSDSLPQSLQALDVVVLSDLLLGRILDMDHDLCDKENLISYFADPEDALAASRDESNGSENGGHLLFLMNHTPVSQVKNVADQGLIMPHKSTFFYPKVLTGLLINKIVPDESIQLLKNTS